MSELVLLPKKANHWRAAALLALIMTIIIRVSQGPQNILVSFEKSGKRVQLEAGDGLLDRPCCIFADGL
jgi:hypothetical protein